MTITIDLNDETERALTALAAARGQNLSQVIQGLVESQLANAAVLTPDARARAWRAGAEGLPSGAPLSDMGASRENFYRSAL